MASKGFIKNTKGAAGVHFVVARLSLRGYVALPTTRNLKSVDIVAFNEALDRFAFIQVKATDKAKGGWPVYTIRKEDGWEPEIQQALARSEKFFYVFVSLPRLSQSEPVYYVVPSADVAEMIVFDMHRYLKKHPRGKAEKTLCALGYDGLSPEFIAKYRDGWGMLGLD